MGDSMRSQICLIRHGITEGNVRKLYYGKTDVPLAQKGVEELEKLAGEKLYGQARPYEGTLRGKKVFCSDVTFDASINPVAYEDGEAVFIDTEYDTWNMDPKALEKAFEIYPDVKLIVVAHLYGTPGKMEEIKKIADAHGALIVEDAAESLGAKYKLNGEWVETGALGDYNCISFNGNNIFEKAA